MQSSSNAATAPGHEVGESIGFPQAQRLGHSGPFTAHDLEQPSPQRVKDLQTVADRASVAATTMGRVLNSGANDADFLWRRYIRVTAGDDGVHIAVGLRRRYGNVGLADTDLGAVYERHRQVPDDRRVLTGPVS